MKQTAEVIADSIGPNGKRITSILINHWRGIHAELLRHRLFSFSVASSRAIPYSVQSKQVKEDPMMPVLWPRSHKGMQGTEVFEGKEHEEMNDKWVSAKDDMLYHTERYTERGLSKQLTNRLLEPWVNSCCVITATEWGNFFRLRCPTTKVTALSGSPIKGDFDWWADEIQLDFPAEYNIQDLAIKMKKALDASTPTELRQGQWHLPFISQDDIDAYTEADQCASVHWDILKKISAARCARTSYGKNLGKTDRDDLALAETLLKEHHLSPFEHQAMAINEKYTEVGGVYLDVCNMPDGLEVRVDNNQRTHFWSGNLQGWVQYRKVIE